MSNRGSAAAMRQPAGVRMTAWMLTALFVLQGPISAARTLDQGDPRDRPSPGAARKEGAGPEHGAAKAELVALRGKIRSLLVQNDVLRRRIRFFDAAGLTGEGTWRLPDGSITDEEPPRAIRKLEMLIELNQGRIQTHGERIVEIEDEGLSDGERSPRYGTHGFTAMYGSDTPEMLRDRIRRYEESIRHEREVLAEIEHIMRTVSNYNESPARERWWALLGSTVAGPRKAEDAADGLRRSIEQSERLLQENRDRLARLEQAIADGERVQRERRGDESGPGTQQFQELMFAMGFIWIEKPRRWINILDRSEEEIERRAGSVREQIRGFAVDLPYEAQDIINRILAQIERDPSPAQALARLMRLRNGIFMMSRAEEMAHRDVGVVETVGVGMNVISIATPGANDYRDFYELTEGKDMWTERELAWWEQALCGVGLVVGAGAAYRQLFKGSSGAVKAAERALIEGAELGVEQARALRFADEIIEGGEDARRALQTMLEETPGALERYRAFVQAQEMAARKVDEFAAAMKTGSGEKKLAALFEIQGDWQAIAELNRRSDELKIGFNKLLGGIYDDVDDLVRKRAVAHFSEVEGQGFAMRIREEHVSVFCASNPSAKIKVSKDRDFTLRLFGVDLPSDLSEDLYNQALHEVLRKRGVIGKEMDPKKLGQLWDQVSVNWRHAEAYNGHDLHNVLNPTTFHFADPEQISLVVAHKGREHFTEAAHLARHGGNARRAEQHMAEGLYQLTKQYRNQLEKFVGIAQDAGKKVEIPPGLSKAVEVVRLVEEKRLTPVEAELVIKGLGFDPDRLAQAIGTNLAALTKIAVEAQ